MNRDEKLAKLAESKASKDMVILTNGEPFIKAFQAKIDKLESITSDGVEIHNLDQLIDELQQINGLKKFVLDFKSELTEVVKAIPQIPDNIEVKGLVDLYDRLKEIAERKDVHIEQVNVKQLDRLDSSISSLVQKVAALKATKPAQRPEDYMPFRRVVRVEGVGLLFDDSFYTGGGGGGSDGVIRGANGGSATVTGGKLDVNATVSTAGLATSTIQTDGSQKTQLVDAGGEAATVTGGKLDVNAAIDTTGLATTATDTNTAAISTVAGAKTDAKSAATDATSISMMQVMKQISASVQAPPSQAVTNAGTFAVQATLAAETTKIIGAINNLPATVDTNSGNKSASTLRVVLATDQPALTNKLLVTPDSVALPANQSVNVSQINGVTPLMGVGASGTGAARVVLANDQGKTLVSTGGSAASSGNNTLISAGTNKLKIYAFSLSTVSTTAVTCIFQSGASGTELWRVVLQAGTGTSTGANLVVQPPAWLFATASATLLNLNLSAAQTVHWSVSYFDEA